MTQPFPNICPLLGHLRGGLNVAVNELEPNRRLASALKVVIVAVGVAAILAHLMR